MDVTDEETMQTHFISMLSYIQDYDDIISMMGQTTDYPNRYQDMINYVKKNGLKIHGFAVYAKKKNLLELYKQDMVSYVQTILKIKKEVQIYQKRYFCTFLIKSSKQRSGL